MADDRLDPIAALLAEHACRALVVKAAELVDSGRFSGLAAVFSSDALLVRPNGATLSGCDAIVASYAARPVDRISRHLIFASNFTGLNAEHAAATTQVLLWSGSTDDAPGPFGRPARGQQIVGRFDDEFVFIDRAWRIGKRVASFELFVVNP
ncbi:nuclear transport factor 2 family protein [Paraburkholderia sp. MMS20-SJTR3]|uniref:Nuclear transport factor 2 family protein n=1 Tax=Paraburkholderia sejongensis TaxID=2886946 RepID=A0ABS8K693_9BURK|nr:nuclear transport factor 2 family protein [Paraburkholderia sp. MMS20-SJTR3]MCC8397666.1 nuclear transport factor 2 family protein [Paraburkholderia sp. MMS20-SJTR3]